MSNQNQDNRSWGEFIVSNSAFDFMRKSINFNLFGNKEPKDVWENIFAGELTTSDMDGILSHAFSNHVKVSGGKLIYSPNAKCCQCYEPTSTKYDE